jgi:hypothetical protein
MHTLTEGNVSKVEGRKLGLTTVNSGVVVEEASRKGGGRGFELRWPCCGATLHEKMRDLRLDHGWVDGRWTLP